MKTNRIKPETGFMLTLLAAACVFSGGCGQKPQKIFRVGIISGSKPFANIADGFKAKMTELGYVEGKNIVYELKDSYANPNGSRQDAGKFVADKVDLIFAFPTEPALAAKTAALGSGIPVLFAMSGIEGTGLVESVSRPGGNITGVRFPGSELMAKRLDILCELAPKARRIYLVYDRNYPLAAATLGQLRQAAAPLGVKLVEEPVNDLDGLRAVLRKRAAMKDPGIDAIMIMPEILTQTPAGFAAIIKFADEHNMPIAGAAGPTVYLGAIFSFTPDNVEIGGHAATLADKILKGVPAGEIMVVTPEAYLRLNYKVIQKLGLTANEGLLSRAKEIIR